jgi:hypothetical protein
MIGPYESEEEMLEAILYWQKRALEAERDLKESLDYNEEYVDMILEAEKKLDHQIHFSNMIFEWYDQTVTEKEYYKQQFLDKQKEIEVLIKMSGIR